MKILLAGGGTMGSVAPLLAVAPELQKKDHTVVCVGTVGGPEKAVIEEQGLQFFGVHAAKLRRYLTWRHIFVPFEFVQSLLEARRILRAEQPDVIVSAGGFVAVPIIFVGRWLGIPSVIHQQDIVPTLSNVITARCTRSISTAFQQSLADFQKYQSATRTVSWIGNPVRDLHPTTKTIQPLLDAAFPTIFIMGGGTGAAGINALVSEKLCDVANVIHLTGKDKATPHINHPRYHRFEFLTAEYAECLELATLVVSRAGIGSLTELAYLGKPTVLIPMPDSHQEANAAAAFKIGGARVVAQSTLTPESFADLVQELLRDTAQQQGLAKRLHEDLFPPAANQQFIELIERA